MGAGLTSLDVVVLAVVGIAAAFGLMRGFVAELFSLAAWVAGFFAVRALHGPVTEALVGPVGTRGGASLLAVLVIFGVVSMAVRIVGNRLSTGTRSSVLGPVDRLLGFGFGALKGLLVATLAFLLMTLVQDVVSGTKAPRPAWMTQSRTYDLLRASSAALVDAIEAQRAR